MVNPLEHIRLHPKLAKQLIGLTLPQLEHLIKKAIALDEQRQDLDFILEAINKLFNSFFASLLILMLSIPDVTVLTGIFSKIFKLGF